MQFTKNIVVIALTLFCLVSFDGILSKKIKKAEKKGKQVNLVHDMNGFNSQINHVVRRDPSLTAITRLGAYRLPAPQTVNHFSNSNTSNAPNVGNLGTRAEIVQPHVVLHSKTPVSVVKETPAHIGWRNENKSITSLNNETGKVESHQLSNKTPIYGNIQEVIMIYLYLG